MNFKTSLFLLLIGFLLQACAPTGPVKFFEGQDRPNSEIARVMVPGPITVESIDGREVKVPSKEEGFYELRLLPGKHIIAFKYKLYWGSINSGMLVKSDLAAVDTNFEAGKVYELTYKKPKDEEEAFAFSNDFKATLIDRTSGQKTASFKIKNLEAALLARNTQQNNGAAQTVAAPKTQAMPTADQAVNEDPVKRLKFWWLMASEKERKAFREWMNSVPPNFGKK